MTMLRLFREWWKGRTYLEDRLYRKLFLPMVLGNLIGTLLLQILAPIPTLNSLFLFFLFAFALSICVVLLLTFLKLLP